MISRRDFLATLAKLAAIVGGAGVILFDPLFEGKFMIVEIVNLDEDTEF
jgi:hypothetical protein